MKKQKKRKRRITRHHLKNRINGGDSSPENMLKLTQDRHNLLHVLFGNLDLYDIVILLVRIGRLKRYHHINPKFRELYSICNESEKRLRKKTQRLS